MIKKFGFYIGILLMAIVIFNININDSYAATEYTTSDGNYIYVEYTNGCVGITTYKGIANVVVIPSTIDGKPVYQIEDGAFCSTLRADANSGITSVTIPSSVTTIGKHVFKDCIGLTSVSLPDGLLAISEGVFENCNTLPTIIIPNTVKTFGDYAFLNCWEIESINIPVGVTEIGRQAFRNCVKLNNIVIPNTMTEIGPAVFLGCRALATITLPDTVTSIGNQAFADCILLTDINTLLTHVETIGISAFTNCIGLTTLILPEDTNVTSIGISAFNGCSGLTSVQLNGALTTLSKGVFKNCSNLQAVTLPSSLANISDELFSECNQLETVILPSTVTSIGSSSFFGCDGLTALTIPMGVTAIDRYAFQGCDGITEISLPESLTSIDVWAFKDCTQLKKITVNSSTTILDANFIEGCHADLAIHGYVGSTAQTYADKDSSTNDADDSIDFVVERLAITVTQENVKAYGGNDGKITVTVPSGIISEYRTNGAWQSSHVFDNLSAGTYSVIAREKANIDNISLTTSVTITQPNRPSSSVSLPIKDASTALIEDLIKEGKPNNDGVIEVELKIDVDENGKSELELPSNFLDKEVEILIKTDKVNVRLSSSMFKGSEKKITLVVKPKDKELLKLSEEAKQKIGDMPVYDISLKIDSKRVDWKGDEDIEIAFNLDKKGKEAHKFVAVYIDDNGNIQFLKSSYYSDGMMHFKTKHLSDYGMIYVDKVFADSESHWAKEAIEALAARGIINGTSDATFAPQNNITRADFITLVVRYFGFAGDNIDSFSDVDRSMYYTESIAIAKDLGIVTGNGDGTFDPTAEITRQDMMVILSRALSVANKDLETSNKSYTSFNDSVSVASYAIESVDYMISTGLIHGSDGKINPIGTATRAEVAQLLYNLLIELNK